MDAKLTKLLELIAIRSREISNLSEGVNERIEEVEDALTQINVGVTLQESILVEAEGAEWLIGYRKFGDKDWGISVRVRDQQSTIRLLKAPRVVRIAALACLGLLLSEIKNEQDMILMNLRGIICL